MNDQTNQNGVDNPQLQNQQNLNNITPEIPVQPVQDIVQPVAPVQQAVPTEVAQPVAPAQQAVPTEVAQPVAPAQQAVPTYAATPITPVEAPKKTNGLCIAAIILAFLFPLIGLILAIVGLISSKKKAQKGKGLAIAAIIFSILMPIVYVFAIIALIGGGLTSLVNGATDAATALQEGCESIDENGNYESSDGTVICEDYECKYTNGNASLSSTCNLINTNDEEDNYDDADDEEDDNYYDDNEEDYDNNYSDDDDYNDDNSDDNNGNNIIDPQTITKIDLPSTKWELKDSSEIVFEYSTFKWYKEVDKYDDNYYAGTYKFYMGKPAFDYLTQDLSEYGVTSEELQDLFNNNELYSEENLIVLVLEQTSSTIEGTTTTTPKTIPLYGFSMPDGSLMVLVNMDTIATYQFTKR